MSELHPLFINSANANIFALHHALPQDANASVILTLQPFAEEMNKSRRMMTVLARELRPYNIELFTFDYYGTGDSEGDFQDARLELWLENIGDSIKWLNEHDRTNIILLGSRLGALLACRYLSASTMKNSKLIFWQPVLNGEQHVNQFLRTRVAAEMSRETTAKKITVNDIWDSMQKEGSAEVAGYQCAYELMHELSLLRFDEQQFSQDMTCHWVEQCANPDAGASYQSKKVITALQERGVNISLTCCAGEPFWATQEIVVNQCMVNATVSAILNG